MVRSSGQRRQQHNVSDHRAKGLHPEGRKSSTSESTVDGRLHRDRRLKSTAAVQPEQRQRSGHAHEREAGPEKPAKTNTLSRAHDGAGGEIAYQHPNSHDGVVEPVMSGHKTPAGQ